MQSCVIQYIGWNKGARIQYTPGYIVNVPIYCFVEKVIKLSVIYFPWLRTSEMLSQPQNIYIYPLHFLFERKK